MNKELISNFQKMFNTRTLVQIACVLGGLLALKASGALLGFDWLKALAAG
jgi:hypothetical protein